MIHWSPFVQNFKKKYPWVQLAGHQGWFALLIICVLFCNAHQHLMFVHQKSWICAKCLLQFRWLLHYAVMLNHSLGWNSSVSKDRGLGILPDFVIILVTFLQKEKKKENSLKWKTRWFHSQLFISFHLVTCWYHDFKGWPTKFTQWCKTS